MIETWDDTAEVEMGENVLYSLEKGNGWLVACMDKMYYPTTTGNLWHENFDGENHMIFPLNSDPFFSKIDKATEQNYLTYRPLQCVLAIKKKILSKY